MPDVLCSFFNIYFLLIFVRILFSWFPVTPGTTLAQIYSVLFAVTEPVLGPLRRAIPPVRMGGMGLDLSPLIVLVGGRILLGALGC